MRVKILYFGLIRRYVPAGQEELELPEGSTVGDLVALLAKKHGTEFHEHLISQHQGSVPEILPHAFITLDGRNVTGLQGLDTLLPPDVDTHIVLVGPVVTGG
ncbi:MAG: MoaD/ThiS family protein [Anaerolineae bacterium]